MAEKNYDLEDKINLIYDYLYNINTKNCFGFNKIELGKIGLDDIKIQQPLTENKEDDDFYQINKDAILNGRFKLITFDEETNQIFFKKYSDQFSLNVKVNFYSPDEKIINSFSSPINNDSLFSYLLSQLVLGKKTNHILIPIINFDIKFSEIEKLIKEDTSYSIIKNNIMNNIISDTCCLHLRENFFKTTNLEEYLSQNSCSYKGLLFQIIHTLTILQNEYDGFRHNNLILKNILVYLKKSTDSYTEYVGFKNDTFYLPNIGFDIKITNFETAVIPKHYGLSNLKNPNIKFADKINPYYDLFTFLNSLMSSTNQNEKNKCTEDIKKFIDKILPPSVKDFNKNYIIVKPIDLLYDDFFKEFRNKPSKNYIKESISNNQYLTGQKSGLESGSNNFTTLMDSDNYSILGNQDKIKSNLNIMINSRTIKSTKSTKSKESKGKKILEDIDDDDEIINTRKIKQSGGYEKTETLPYKAEKNTPFMSNDQRDTNKKRAAENPVREPPVLIEQKIYDTSKQQPAKSQFPPNFIPLHGEEGQMLGLNNMLPYSRAINQPPVQKIYNVSLSNPLGNHTTLNRIYEDVLPGDQFNFSSLTLFERKQLIDFLRNNIIQKNDGEEMNLNGGNNSLLSHIKVMDVNPYTINKNPYHDLAKDFLLYRAGYPIRFDEKVRNITMGKPSMGINIRMYMMTIGDLKSNIVGSNIDKEDFDLWRELKYYDWVRDELVKRKVSPNFISPILYKIDSESKLDWQKLELIKAKGPTDILQKLKANQQTINNKHSLIKNLGLFQNLLPLQFRKGITSAITPNVIEDEVSWKANLKILDAYLLTNNKLPASTDPDSTVIALEFWMANQHRYFLTNSYIMQNNNIKDMWYKFLINWKQYFENNKQYALDKQDLTVNSGKVLLLLTEAPTSSIIQWSSTIYEPYGSVKKMIGTGYHTPSIWKSILFQLTYAYAVLEKKEIYMENISLEKNVYIKDIFSDPNAIGSWIYKVDNIEYYIPNYGYILMFDSKYTDIDTTQKFSMSGVPVPLSPPSINAQKQYKINSSKLFNKNSLALIGSIKDDIRRQFKELINPDNFSHNFKIKGGSIPDSDIITLLTTMYNHVIPTTGNMTDYFTIFFGEFVHNRVGSLLLKSEKDNISVFSRPNFNKGNLMIWQKRFQEYEWVIYIGPAPLSPLKKLVLIKNINGNYTESEVFTSSLYGYPENEKVLPESKKNMKYDETYIYETYNLDNLQ